MEPVYDDEDATHYDVVLGLQQVRFWLAAIVAVLLLILWRLW